MFVLPNLELALIAFVALASTLPAQDVGFEGPSFSSACVNPPPNCNVDDVDPDPSAEKPESKLWFNDGKWWGSLWSDSGNAFRIHRHKVTTPSAPPPVQDLHQWIDTGVVIDDRSGSHCDVLWDGTKLYIASHVFSTVTPVAGEIRFFRYSYVGGAYSLDSGFPVPIGDSLSNEALVIDKELSTGS